MKKRQLGKTDLLVAPITLGSNVFGWTVDEKRSFEILDGFAGAGYNFIDTADSYSRWVPGHQGGEAETIIGRWMKQKNNRQQMIIATKVGSDMGNGKMGLRKKHILEAVDESLSRLQTDYIDLYQTHFDEESTPVQETLEAYDQLVKAGKVRWIGASNISAERLQESLDTSKSRGLVRYQTLQPLYNLYDRELFEMETEQICLHNKLGVLNYYSLASGFLTGKYRSKDDLDKSARGPGIQKYLNPRGFRILDALDKISDQYNTDQATVALAWLLKRPSITAPIVSATSLGQLKSILQAPELNLDAKAMNLLNKASDWKIDQFANAEHHL